MTGIKELTNVCILVYTNVIKWRGHNKVGAKVTIKQIAQLANVDVSTVSRALSGSNRVKYETRQEIMQIAERLNYRPNSLARSLVNGRTQSIGVVLPEISNSFYAGVISSLEPVMVAAGYSILLGLSHYDSNIQNSCLELFDAKMVDGIIIFPGISGKLWAKGCIKRLRAPVVMLDYDADESRTDIVASDHIAGVRLGVEYLVGLGHKRIAFVTDDVTTNERLEAFVDSTRRHGLDVSDHIIRSEVKYERGGYESVQRLFTGENPPTAVFCANDYMGIGVMKALSERGLRVPEDVSVMGFDDSTLMNYLQCPLTTIRQHKHRLGEEAGKLLLERMSAIARGEESPYTKITIQPELVVRSSTGPCRE